jgi:hypothetical protein
VNVTEHEHGSICPTRIQHKLEEKEERRRKKRSTISMKKKNINKWYRKELRKQNSK